MFKIFFCILAIAVETQSIPMYHLYDEIDPNARATKIIHHKDNSTRVKQFSGVYTPLHTTSEHYAGAWLTSKKQLLKNEEYITRIMQLENIQESFVLNEVSVMTRDFLDFQVLHLSSTIQQFPNLENPKHREELLYYTNKTVDALEMRDPANLQYRYKNRRILDQTVVVIPFSNSFASQFVDVSRGKFFVEINELFLEATFWSNYRIFPKIIVVCGSAEVLTTVKLLNLPIWKYVDLSTGLSSVDKQFYQLNRNLIPGQSLLYVIGKLNQKDIAPLDEDKEWKNIQYVYYTEADNILISRYLPYIYSLLNRLKGEVVIVPHRMLTIAIPHIYPGIKSAWDKHWPKEKLKKISQSQLIVEDLLVPRGSCCDSGRFQFASCPEMLWYKCSNWGLQNYSQWIQYREYGFTMPTGTEHQARCNYSPVRQTCELFTVKDCTQSMPMTKHDVCGEANIRISIPSTAID